jgi:hypothetical protein
MNTQIVETIVQWVSWLKSIIAIFEALFWFQNGVRIDCYLGHVYIGSLHAIT